MRKATALGDQRLLISRRYYSTKMSLLTLAVGMEPEDYFRNRIKQKWSLARIYLELRGISKRFGLDMMTERGLRLWIDKVNHKKKR